MSVMANTGNYFLDSRASHINALDALPKATSGDNSTDVGDLIETFGTMIKTAGINDDSSAGKSGPIPIPIQIPNPFAKIDQEGGLGALSGSINDWQARANAAKLADPSIEPQFNVPGVSASMQTPSNFSLFPNGTPSPHDVEQTVNNDCYLNATLASLAQQDPSFVQNMVHDNGDGTFTVHMFDPAGRPVDVTVNNQVPVDSHGNMVGDHGPNDQANWVTIVEKAFVKYNDVYKVAGNRTDTGYLGIKSGLPAPAFEALTGMNAAEYANADYNPADQNALAQVMQGDLKNGQTIFVSNDKTDNLASGVELPGDHEYSVIDVNQDANGNWYVDVRDPFAVSPLEYPGLGNGIPDKSNTTSDGVTRMSMSDYLQDLDVTTIGDKLPGAPGNDTLYPGTTPIDGDKPQPRVPAGLYGKP